MPSEAAAKRVLVAEDEPTLLRLMERVLEREGYSVLTAANGDEALQCLAQHAGEIGSAILDAAIVPRGAGEIVAAVAKHCGDASLVFTSGDSIGGTLRQLMVDHAAVFLRKPFPPEALLQALEESAIRDLE